MSDEEVITVFEVDVVRIEDRLRGRTVTLTAGQILALNDAHEVATNLRVALSGLVKMQTDGVRTLSGAGFSTETMTAYLNRTNESIRTFAEAFARALTDAVGGQ